MITTVAMVTSRSEREQVLAFAADGGTSALQLLKKNNVSCSLNGPNLL